MPKYLLLTINSDILNQLWYTTIKEESCWSHDSNVTAA